MSHPSRRATQSVCGSALVLVLLVTALLATITVSFLSTSRVEQIAAKNFSRQNAAAGLAEMATQQAMASIQTAFNGNGTGTGIVVTQPGAISKYFFSNGTCINPTTATTDLFYTSNSANANGTLNMNNLFANSTVSGLITGNASEAITVGSVNVLSGNQVIGKVAYYVDDELTKINLNSVAGNRTTINFSYGKAASLSGASNFTGNITNFDFVINGSTKNGSTTANNTTMSNWTSFFRSEQARTILGMNTTEWARWQANISAAPLSDFHLKYTPWGTERLFINDEPITDIGVTNIYSALSGLDAAGNPASTSSANPYEINGMALRNIYNGTFSDKYTSNGTKQIAANILQMRDKNTINPDFNWRGPILGSGNLSSGIPQSYFAYTPFPVINEVAIQPEKDEANGLLHLCVYVEIWPAYNTQFSNDSLEKELIVELTNGSFTTDNSTSYFSPSKISRLLPGGDSNSSKRIVRFDFSLATSSFNGTLSVDMGDIRLLAKPGDDTSIRDWIEGTVINKLLPINATINSTNTVNWTVGDLISIGTSYDDKGDATASSNVISWNTKNNTQSIQRKDIRIAKDSSGNYSTSNNSSTSPWGVNLHTLCSKDSNYDKIIEFKQYVPAQVCMEGNNKYNTTGKVAYQCGDVMVRDTMTAKTAPFFVGSGYRTSDWPSDKFDQDEDCINFRFAYQYRYFRQTLFAKDSSGNGLYVWPGDLGKVMTDRMYRTLRMFWQPTQERARGFIPDWALLDLVSFSSNKTSQLPLKIAPMNLNGSFNCLPAPAYAPTPKPRNNIECLTKSFDFVGNETCSVASSIARTDTPVTYDNTLPPDGVYALPQQASYAFRDSARWYGAGAGISSAMSGNITQHIISNSSIAWAKSGNQTWSSYRASKNWPQSKLVIPSEVSEIKNISDFQRYDGRMLWPDSGPSETLENRLAAFFPGLTLCSNFFTIYAYAQALDKAGNIDSEALTKTLVEAEVIPPSTSSNGTTTPATYKVKKLYTQPIPLGQ